MGFAIPVALSCRRFYTLSVARRGCRDCPEDKGRPTHSPDLDRELSFHYDREERESYRLRPLPDHSSNNPFRRNRSLLILAIDVLVVLLLAGLYFYFLRGDPTEAVIEGYRFNLEARRFAEGTLISVDAVTEDGQAPPGEPFHLRLLEPSPQLLRDATSADTVLSSDVERLLRGEELFDLLPTQGRRTVRLLFPRELATGELSLEVGWGGQTAELTVLLEGNGTVEE